MTSAEVPPVLGPTIRPRRLRTTPALRRMVAETSLEARQLVLPLFVREDITEPVPIGSMPGVVQHTRSTLLAAVTEAASLGLGGVMLFGIPTAKDAVGSGATDPNGILVELCLDRPGIPVDEAEAERLMHATPDA